MAFCWVGYPKGDNSEYIVKKCLSDCLTSKGFTTDAQKQNYILGQELVVDGKFYSYPAEYSAAINKAREMNGLAPNTIDGKPKVVLQISLSNPKGIVPDSASIHRAVSTVVDPIGWEVNSVSIGTTYLEITFVKQGSPLLPVIAIIGAILIVWSGITVISTKLITYFIEAEQTKQMETELSKMKTTQDLIDGTNTMYEEGRIDTPTYQTLIKQLTGTASQVAVQSSTSQSNETGSGIGSSNMVPLAIGGGVLILLAAIMLKS